MLTIYGKGQTGFSAMAFRVDSFYTSAEWESAD